MDYEEVCDKVFNVYKSVMNNLAVKTDIAQAIFMDKNWNDNGIVFIGSYMSFPSDIERSVKLQEFYTDPETKESTVDAKPFNNVVKNLSSDLKKAMNNSFIAFVIGAVAKDNNVSHHIGFIYDTKSKILKMFDPGQRSWGPESAQIVKSVADAAFEKIKTPYNLVEAYSGTWFCNRCVGPQDVCRGGYIDEFKTAEDSTIITGGTRGIKNPFYDAHASLHRESFCQTWSLILILNEIQKIQEIGPDQFGVPMMAEWSKMPKKELEICIRRFILWIVNKFPSDFETEWLNHENTTNKNQYRMLLLKCMKHFNEVLEVPKKGTNMCGGLTLQTSVVQNRKKRRKM